MFDTQVANLGCAYSRIVFYTNVGKAFLANIFMDGKTTFEHNLYANLWKQMDCTILNGKTL
jgi:hypothetical protein